MSNPPNKVRILQNLKMNLVQFFEEMNTIFPRESSFILARVFIEHQVQPHEIMEYIIINLLPVKDEIQNKNEEFFLNEDNEFLKQINPTRKNQFKTLWTTIKDEDCKNTIWEYFSVFIKLAERYSDIKE